jgi:hypothetical protein
MPVRTSKKGMSSSVENFMALTVVDGAHNFGHILRHVVVAGKISENPGTCSKIKQNHSFRGLVGTYP